MNRVNRLMPHRIGYTHALRRTWFWALLFGAYSSLALLKGYAPFRYLPDFPVALDAAVGFAMGVLIALRVNRAYERWWEARTLWGTLVNVSRNLAIKVKCLIPSPEADEQLRVLLVAYCYGLRDHLRGESELQKLPGFADCPDQPAHVPSYLVSRIYGLFVDWRRHGQMAEMDLWVIDQEARLFLDVCGACERIKTTLMSVSWRVLTRQCIGLYLLVFPWGLVDDFGAWVVPISIALSYVVLGGEAIADYVEEPFGESEDHLDLDAICAGIERTVNEIIPPDREP